MGVGTTAGTSYQNATAAWKLSQFADHVINRNEWKKRDKVAERMEKAGYQMDQSNDQKKLSFWDAYSNEMETELASSARSETTQIATTGSEIAFYEYKAAQTKEHFHGAGVGKANR